MNKDKLDKILENHRHWLNKDCEGWKGMRADLSRANLSMADLSMANLSMADLSGANLSRADLSWAYLLWANLSGADLLWANLSGAKLPKGEEYRKGVILRDDMIGYKKCHNGVIVTLKIPKGSVVFCINGSKCRANSAIVTAIDGAERAYSQYNGMSYYVGDRFNIWNFDCEYNNECSTGIHFFRTRKEAENY